VRVLLVASVTAGLLLAAVPLASPATAAAVWPLLPVVAFTVAVLASVVGLGLLVAAHPRRRLSPHRHSQHRRRRGAGGPDGGLDTGDTGARAGAGWPQRQGFPPAGPSGTGESHTHIQHGVPRPSPPSDDRVGASGDAEVESRYATPRARRYSGPS